MRLKSSVCELTTEVFNYAVVINTFINEKKETKKFQSVIDSVKPNTFNWLRSDGIDIAFFTDLRIHENEYDIYLQLIDFT